MSLSSFQSPRARDPNRTARVIASAYLVCSASRKSFSHSQAPGRRYFRFGSPLFRHSDLLLGAVHCGSSVGSISDSDSGQATSGAQALWGRETMGGMAHGGLAQGNRLDGEVGYTGCRSGGASWGRRGSASAPRSTARTIGSATAWACSTGRAWRSSWGSRRGAATVRYWAARATACSGGPPWGGRAPRSRSAVTAGTSSETSPGGLQNDPGRANQAQRVARHGLDREQSALVCIHIRLGDRPDGDHALAGSGRIGLTPVRRTWAVPCGTGGILPAADRVSCQELKGRRQEVTDERGVEALARADPRNTGGRARGRLLRGGTWRVQPQHRAGSEVGCAGIQGLVSGTVPDGVSSQRRNGGRLHRRDGAHQDPGDGASLHVEHRHGAQGTPGDQPAGQRGRPVRAATDVPAARAPGLVAGVVSERLCLTSDRSCRSLSGTLDAAC